MLERIVKDIRFYESEKPNVEGQRLPQPLGKLFFPTKDTVYIGQRIARKLNELRYACSEFDHIYINFTTCIQACEVVVSNRNVDKRVRYVDFGIDAEKLNTSSAIEKDNFVKSATFKVLRQLSQGQNLAFVKETEKLIAQYDTEIRIHFKTKETNFYKIIIYYQIQSLNGGTKAIIEYFDKKRNSLQVGNYKLQHYEDIYTLIDTISLVDDKIVLKPKKSYVADIANKRYDTPIVLPLSGLTMSE